MWTLLLLLACGQPPPEAADARALTSPWTDWALPMGEASVVVSRSQALHLRTEESLVDAFDHWIGALGHSGWTENHRAATDTLAVARLQKGTSTRLHLAVRRQAGQTTVTLALTPAPPPPPGFEL